MSYKRKIGLLIGALALLLAAIVFLQVDHTADSKETEGNGFESLSENPSIGSGHPVKEEIFCVKIDNPAFSLCRDRDTLKWSMEPGFRLPLEKDAIEHFVEYLVAPTDLKPLVDPERKGSSVFGLDSPERVISLYDEHGTLVDSITIGSVKAADGGRYLTFAEAEVVFHIGPVSASLLLSDPTDLRPKSIPVIPHETVEGVFIETEGGAIRMRRISRFDPLYPPLTLLEMVEPYDPPVAVDSSRIKQLVEHISNLEVGMYYDASFPHRKSMEKASPFFSILWKDQTRKKIDFYHLQEAAGAYVIGVPDWGEWYFDMNDPELLLSLMEESPFSYVSPFVSLIPIQLVEAITLEAEQRWHIVIDSGSNGYLNDILLSTKDIKDLYREIISLSLDDDLSEVKIKNNESGSRTNSPYLSITYRYNEKVEKAEEERIRFYRLDRNYLALERRGSRNFVIARRKVDRLLEYLVSLSNTISR